MKTADEILALVARAYPSRTSYSPSGDLIVEWQVEGRCVNADLSEDPNAVEWMAEAGGKTEQWITDYATFRRVLSVAVTESTA